MSASSQLIQPIISTEALSTLTTAVLQTGAESVCGTAFSAKSHGYTRYSQVLKTSIPLLAADFGAVAGGYLLSTFTANAILDIHFRSSVWNNLLAVCLCHLMVGTFLGLFPASGMNPVRELRNQLTSIGAAFVLLVSLNGLLGEVTGNESLTLVFAVPLVAVAAPIFRFGMRRLCAPFRWWGERVVVVGNGPQGRLVYEFLNRQAQRGLKPLGIVDGLGEDSQGGDVAILGTVEELVEICRRQDCLWVIACVADKNQAELRTILANASLVPNLVLLNSSLMHPTLWTTSFDAAGLSGFQIRDRLLCPYLRFFKRLADVLVAATLIVLLGPVWIGISLLVRYKAGGPVFFRHQRIGRYGKPFGAWKFRTMVADSSRVLQDFLASNPEAKAEWEHFHKLKNDPRVIPGIGGFLRKSSLDELPQLWNVLIGEMSLVGPRPVYTNDEILMYGHLYPLYLRVRPGLTGLWQISGRNNTTFADKVWMDTYYVMNWSPWLDYFILLRTFRTVLLREGSY